MIDKDKLFSMRHSVAHILAAAVLELFSGTKMGVGPVIDNGFFYDFDTEHRFTPLDLKKIEKRMKRIIARNDDFIREELSIADAEKLFKKNKQTYKLELIKILKSKGTTKINEEESFDIKPGAKKVSIYYTGSFFDLCQGPHVKNSKEIGVFKLDRLAGAYWRGDEKNPQLQRIYGFAFNTQKELDAYLHMLDEAEKRDHRKLGKELQLFTFDKKVGAGLPLWLPNGTIITEELEKLAKEVEMDYKRVKTPHIGKEDLYLTSGHLPYYKDDMFPAMKLDNEKYYLKAMNCPHHHVIYSSSPKSYRDLPLRIAEYGTVYRYEQSGTLFGIMRSRMLSMNDAHIYVTPEQFEKEFLAVCDIYLKYFKLFNIKKYEMRLSTHDPDELGKKYVNEPKLWKQTEDMVRRAMKKSKLHYTEVSGEAAFYGPKIDVEIWSAIGREFTLATNQVDFSQPRRFNLTYTDNKGKPQTPIVIHRAPLSTHERFIGFLIEHYAGAFPVWLSPVQVVIIPVGEKHVKESERMQNIIKGADIRVEVYDMNETVGYKIRQAETQKVPYSIVIGDEEMKSKRVAVRTRGSKELKKQSLDAFIKSLQKQIEDRS